jgi:hypothetical protein
LSAKLTPDLADTGIGKTAADVNYPNAPASNSQSYIGAYTGPVATTGDGRTGLTGDKFCVIWNDIAAGK